MEIPRKLIYQCQRGGFASKLTLGPYPNLTRRSGMFIFFSTPTTSYLKGCTHCALCSDMNTENRSLWEEVPEWPFHGPLGYLCFRFPSSGCWVSMSAAALLFPSTSNDSCLISHDFWLTSNDLLFTSNDFWLTSYDF